jgi:phosphopentomutase
MPTVKRVFLIVLDSFGIGALPDAASYGDEGSNTLKACFDTGVLAVPNLTRLGLFNLDGVTFGTPVARPAGAFARLAEQSAGKDTTIGHWEIAGLISPQAMPTYPNGFPKEIIAAFEQRTGRGTLCNRPYSGTQVLEDFGAEHLATGKLIVYTSADSVFQLAAHESIVPVEQLYTYCQIARDLLQGEHAVGRVIARPFEGEPGQFRRTARRHDFSLLPPRPTILDDLQQAGLQTISIGKISDIFAGQGISRSLPTVSNEDGMDKLLAIAEEDWHGLCFVNLVEFDMVYGHRNDAVGYAQALNRFDQRLGDLLPLLHENDVLMITADHGCDPATPSTDHSREYVPLLVWGHLIPPGLATGTRATFADAGATVTALLGVATRTAGKSLF